MPTFRRCDLCNYIIYLNKGKMKKAIYIWMLCLGGLFFSQQSFAQRGRAERGHHSSKAYKKAQKNYRKGHAKAYKNIRKNRAHYSHGKRSVYTNNRGHYNRRPTPHYNSHYNHPSVVRRRVISHRFRPAPWAVRRHYNYNRHVYFPDYHAFYDARRHGYVYRHGGRWIFTQVLPSFMVGLNWNNVRIQYLQGVPVNAYPQDYYDTYASRYPAVSFHLNVNL
jgi:hypothetical protein